MHITDFQATSPVPRRWRYTTCNPWKADEEIWPESLCSQERWNWKVYNTRHIHSSEERLDMCEISQILHQDDAKYINAHKPRYGYLQDDMHRVHVCMCACVCVHVCLCMCVYLQSNVNILSVHACHHMMPLIIFCSIHFRGRRTACIVHCLPHGWISWVVHCVHATQTTNLANAT